MPERISIRGGMGLGDAIYLQSVARHFVETGYRPEVCTAWPDVFRPLAGKVDLSPFRRDHIDRLAHYSLRKREKTDQFLDMCRQAGIREDVDLRLDWVPSSTRIADDLRGLGKPVVLVQMMREPMARTDGYGMELLPRRDALQAALDALRGQATLVLIGQGEPKERLNGIDVDLTNRLTVTGLIDLASRADAFLGFVSFIVPLAESFSKPALLVWSRRGLKSRTEYIRTITPEKILHRASSRYVFDDCPAGEIGEAARALLDPR